MPTTKEDLKTKERIIYLLTNSVTGERYIGQSIRTFYHRYHGYSPSLAASAGCPFLHEAIKKYGKEVFSIEILEHDIPGDQMDVREKAYIAQYDTVYPKGYNMSKGGQNPSTSEVVRERMVAAQRKRFKKDYVLIKDGVEYRFDSMAQFARENGLSRNGLCHVTTGLMKTYKGYHLPTADLRFRNRTGNRVRYLEKDGVTYEVCNVARFAREHGLSLTSLHLLFADKLISHEEFRVKGRDRKTRKMNNAKIYGKILLRKVNEILEVPDDYRKDFRTKTKIDVYGLLAGRKRTSKGYVLHKIFDKVGNEMSLPEYRRE